MPELVVPGAIITYDIVGQGPLVLCISGANGDAPIWRLFANNLKEHFTVASYDRRGFSRSSLTSAQDYDNRLDRDADDAAALIHHLSPNAPAIVIGNSSGAIVSLQLLIRRPDAIRFLLPHEPPLIRLCPDFPSLNIAHEAIYETYRKSGPHPALEQFCDLVKAGPERSMLFHQLDSRQNSKGWSNFQYWFEREFPVYPVEEFSLGAFQQHAAKLVPINGAESNRTALQFQANERLARDLNLELQIVPGKHVGFVTHSDEFAAAFLKVMEKKGVV